MLRPASHASAASANLGLVDSLLVVFGYSMAMKNSLPNVELDIGTWRSLLPFSDPSVTTSLVETVVTSACRKLWSWVDCCANKLLYW